MSFYLVLSNMQQLSLLEVWVMEHTESSHWALALDSLGQPTSRCCLVAARYHEALTHCTPACSSTGSCPQGPGGRLHRRHRHRHVDSNRPGNDRVDGQLDSSADCIGTSPAPELHELRIGYLFYA